MNEARAIELETVMGVLKLGLAVIGSLLVLLLSIGGLVAKKMWAKLELLEAAIHARGDQEARLTAAMDEIGLLRARYHEHGNTIQANSERVSKLETWREEHEKITEDRVAGLKELEGRVRTLERG